MIQVVLILAVVGFALYLLLTYVPMAAPIKQLIVFVVVVAVVMWLLNLTGFDIPIPQVHHTR